MGNVTVQTLGCKVNQVESEQIAGEIAERFSIGEADPRVIVINTCAVTGEAEAKTRKAIRRAAADPSVLVVVVTGCAANVSGAALNEIDPKVLVVRDKHLVSAEVQSFLVRQDVALTPGDGSVPHRTRRAVKVQDGCENYCSYCIVPYARGGASSTSLDSVVRHVQDLVDCGVGEVVLTGINIGKYSDPATGAQLPALVSALAGTGLHRVRLSSVEPPDVTDGLISALADQAFGCEHLHIPMQSGSDATLARMARRYTVAEFEAVVSKVRQVWPHAAVTTDVIVGFPGETDADFQETLDTCRRVGFSRIHVFRYSPRTGTPAASMAQLPARVISERAERLRQLGEELADRFEASLVGSEVEVVIERVVGGTAHLTSREYLSYAVPADQLEAAGVRVVEGAVVRMSLSDLTGDTLGLE